MGDFFKEVIKKIPILLIVAGLIFIAIAFVDFEGLTKFKVKDTPNETSWILFSIAVLLIIIGLAWAYFEIKGFQFETHNYEFKKVSNDKYSIIISQGTAHSINIIYGKINDFNGYNKNTVVVLPANDKFDDQCVDDKNSVLGSFVNSLYPNGNVEFKESIKRELQKRENETFAIGNWIYMHNLKSKESEFNVGIVAVTHLKDDGNIVAHSENIMLAFKGIHKMMTQRRISSAFIPLIGSGHGGLTPELSLLCLLISIVEGFRKEDGHKLKNINIVIYKNDNGDKDIPTQRMKQIVEFVLKNCML